MAVARKALNGEFLFPPLRALLEVVDFSSGEDHYEVHAIPLSRL